jgi:hypothetical protein
LAVAFTFGATLRLESPLLQHHLTRKLNAALPEGAELSTGLGLG